MAHSILKKKITAGRRPKPVGLDCGTRASILAAARRLFAQRGLEGTTVRGVAAAARVNNAMIYYHFKDKNDLYRSVLADSFSALATIWNDPFYQSDATVRRKVEKYLEQFIRFQMRNEELRRIMAMEFASSGGDVVWVCGKYFADNFTRLASLIRTGIKNDELKQCDPALVVASLLGVVVHNFIMQPMAEHIQGKKLNLSPEKFGSFVAELFFDGLSRKTTRFGNRMPKRTATE